MSDVRFTDREREYLECEIPLLSTGSAVMRIIGGVFASLGQAVFVPSTSCGKADRGLIKTIREIRYTKYKKAVLRKRDGTLHKNDDKLLAKLNKKDFILAADTYDPDAFTQKVYEEYINRREQTSDNR